MLHLPWQRGLSIGKRDPNLELVEHFFDASVSSERLDRLIFSWDAQISGADPEGSLRLADFAGSVFAQQVSDVLRISSRFANAQLRHANDLLSSLAGAAMVVSEDGVLVAANDAAAAVFGLRPGEFRFEACRSMRRTLTS